jgi:hypothetical protein
MPKTSILQKSLSKSNLLAPVHQEAKKETKLEFRKTQTVLKEVEPQYSYFRPGIDAPSLNTTFDSGISRSMFNCNAEPQPRLRKNPSRDRLESHKGVLSKANSKLRLSQNSKNQE